jgi:hypothetical protein
MQVRFIYWPAVIATSLAVSGCLLNSIQQVHQRTTVESGEALVVIGVGLSAPSPYPTFSVSLDEYSLKKQKITGNCFHYNHMDATISAGQTTVQYFAFRVPAGVYVFSAFNAGPSPHPLPHPAAFIAPKGGVIYFGDYIFVGDHIMELRNSIAAAQIAVRDIIPIKSTLTQADPEPSVERGTAFLCTP